MLFKRSGAEEMTYTNFFYWRNHTSQVAEMMVHFLFREDIFVDLGHCTWDPSNFLPLFTVGNSMTDSFTKPDSMVQTSSREFKIQILLAFLAAMIALRNGSHFSFHTCLCAQCYGSHFLGGWFFCLVYVCFWFFFKPRNRHRQCLGNCFYFACLLKRY